jgi:hypothetical protein
MSSSEELSSSAARRTLSGREATVICAPVLSSELDLSPGQILVTTARVVSWFTDSSVPEDSSVSEESSSSSIGSTLGGFKIGTSLVGDFIFVVSVAPSV